MAWVSLGLASRMCIGQKRHSVNSVMCKGFRQDSRGPLVLREAQEWRKQLGEDVYLQGQVGNYNLGGAPYVHLGREHGGILWKVANRVLVIWGSPWNVREQVLVSGVT